MLGHRLHCRLLVLTLVGIGAGGCAASSEIGQLCEPADLRHGSPDSGPAIVHSVRVAPPQIDDGWSVSTLRSEGFDPQPIQEMISAVEAGEFTKVDSILVARNGRLVLEAYFNGYDRDTPHNARSAVKSVTSALVGIAIDRGLIADVDQPISEFFPERWPYIESDLDRKNRITLANLLTMRSGLRPVQGLKQSQDWYTFALGQPMAGEPGAQFKYDDANSVLIGGVIANAAAIPVPAFARKNLFEPLDITDYCWTMTPAGQAVTSSGFYIRPRDMLKLGQLYSNLGVWNGRRIVSERWVTDSTRPRVLPSRSSVQLSQLAYSYHWRARLLPHGENQRSYYYLAAGGGGQLLFVFPQLDLVVAFNGSHYDSTIGERQHSAMLNDYIAPAIIR